jgi:hypothetical protein
MLKQVADGVWVRLVDPGIDGSDLDQLADDIDALRRGEDPDDARLGPDSDWLPIHRSNLELARRP